MAGKRCPSCNGSGQVGFFQGVSRFLITWEECPECGGIGRLIEEAPPPGEKTSSPNKTKKSGRDKKTLGHP